MSEERLDRFARGELSPAESRELARQALDDPALFEDLTSTAIAAQGLSNLRPKRNLWPRIAALAAAIVVLLVSWYVLRSSRPAPSPVIATGGPPIFLARNSDSTVTFRGTEPDSRAPRTTGSVTSIVGRIATIDLGSLDGLSKGDEVEIVREGKAVGTIRLTTIFRDRARAAASPNVRENDGIRVSPAVYLRAVLDQIEALAARGDSEGARRIAGQADVSGNLDVPGARSEDLNNLGAIAELRGDKATAQSRYEQALGANPPPDSRRIIETNLTRVKGVN